MLPALVSFALSVAVLIGFLYLAGRVLLLNYMFDDWIFADEFVYRKRPELDAHIDHFAREIVAASRDTSFDEVIVSAHSLGGALIMDAFDRALKLDPELGRHGPKLWLMATGSSLLKEALHPKAAWLREASARVADAPGMNWIEYQAIVDVISFYKVNPIEEMGFTPSRNPIVQRVRIRQMLSSETYKRFKGNFFRLHRQWGMGNEVRYFYDYFQTICGPAPLARRVELREKLMDAFSADGGYNRDDDLVHHPSPGAARREENRREGQRAIGARKNPDGDFVFGTRPDPARFCHYESRAHALEISGLRRISVPACARLGGNRGFRVFALAIPAHP
jgi:hypothetical protein